MSKRDNTGTDLGKLSDLAPELAEMLVSVACDIALVLDDSGVIRKVALGGGEPVSTTAEGWIGRHWPDTVTTDTRRKAEEFLADIARSGSSRPRHLNHESLTGDIPITYTAVRLGERGPTLAVGRDLRTVSALQQRLVAAQQDMERDYWQRRQAESRYRLLFHIAAEPTLIVDAVSFAVIHGNRSAGMLLARSADSLQGRALLSEAEPASADAVRGALELARNTGRSAECEARLTLGRGSVDLTITPFQSDASAVLLVRLRTREDAVDELLAPSLFAKIIEHTPDAVVVCSATGRVVLSNPAFRRLLALPDGQVVNGLALAELIGDTETPFAAIVETVKSLGFIPSLQAQLRTALGVAVEIELSATLIPDRDMIALTIRVSNRRDAKIINGGSGPDLARH